jgi:hypothetical protein
MIAGGSAMPAGTTPRVLATEGPGWVEDPDGPWCDAWHCSDIIVALVWLLSPRLAMRLSTFSWHLRGDSAGSLEAGKAAPGYYDITNILRDKYPA